ncbi:vacuolar amino acid transporter 4 [Coprinopsis cinerea okayama7|uniref:Vacuolar amino acid transporter 4 n=1 Tax=Coprinopsis cinerea (strain Okayama-7 / 130 / ATCC MYA-4618 / FGSC 9003) TaxID=240176 RepID=D6RMC3_COPC7|nr:vacuolar amino acid transporter 4 [Coprinopsis cinerea okayama7\|eukprot:XP_002911442.1 vacuolar amino acid transporter 4 [Coprinopsis cinerea okayama7\
MSSPSQPINIKSPKLSSDGQGLSSSFAPSMGTPNRNNLRAPFVGTPPLPNIPPRSSSGTPMQRTGSPMLNNNGFSTAGGPSGISQSFTRPMSISGSPNPNAPNIDFESLTDEDKARVLRKHLVSKDARSKYDGKPKSIAGSELDVPQHGSDNGTSHPDSRRSSVGADDGKRMNREETDPFPIPYNAPGADVTHDIYKWHADQRRQAGRARAVSFHAPEPTPHPAFEHIHEPGGFRRNYLKLRANEQGAEEPPMLDNFIDFLTLFGHFAGEDLEEDEEEKDSDEEAAEAEAELQAAEAAGLGESTPLLRGASASRTRSRSRRRRGASVGPQGGTATVTQAVLMLLKSFIGTGVLFLGKAFFNGGILFSSITFVFIAGISLYSFLLLLDAKNAVPGSFGASKRHFIDIGGILYGPRMRYLILGSIVISQMGFVAAYTIFVAENLQAFVLGITDCLKLVPVQYFILAQLLIFVPLALIRDIAKLSTTALIADVFIFGGLAYIFGSEFKIIAERGIADVKLFNPRDFPLFIGTAVFSFEGIGLVIPISDSMREPHKFPMALTGVMAFLVVLFGGSGVLAYLTFGSEIQTVVLVNLDLRSRMVQTVQFFYAIAILLSVPLQLFPAVRILENGIFTRSGKADPQVKWHKNLFRFGMVVLCSLISWAGAADLDKFVAFVGSFACVPLCYVYPAMLHYKAVARTRRQKLADIAMIVFGLIAAAYTTIQTLKLMIAPSPPAAPVGTCEL